MMMRAAAKIARENTPLVILVHNGMALLIC